MDTQTIIPPDWHRVLISRPQNAHLATVTAAVTAARNTGCIVYPAPEQVFQSLSLTSFESVKVVILGQDPYHGPGQSHGLSFSVPRGERIPPSLRNIYKELASDLNIPPAKHGHLEAWATQGVLLLNAVLTVENGKPGSHQKIGWQLITDALIQCLSAERNGLVFVLWGAYAQKKACLIDAKRHFILKSVHPSPLSASRGFFGSRPFSQINNYLVNQGMTPINWRLPA